MFGSTFSVKYQEKNIKFMKCSLLDDCYTLIVSGEFMPIFREQLVQY